MKDISKMEVMSSVYKLIHTIKEDEEKYVITVRLTIKKGKQGEKYIEDMINKQESPVVKILKQHEKQHKKDIREGKNMYLYNIYKK